MESGQLKYHTPNETMVFSAGWAGMVNSNVLHMTEIQTHKEKNIQLLHIFEPKLLAGDHGSRIEQKYIMPIITSSQIEIIPIKSKGVRAGCGYRPDPQSVFPVRRRVRLRDKDKRGAVTDMAASVSDMRSHTSG